MSDGDELDLDRTLPSGLPGRVHLLGLGGAGVSGAARILVARGHVVSGHDRASSDLLRALEGLAVATRIGASTDADLPADAQLVARSAAVPDEDPQVVEARRRGLPVIKYAELLGRLAPAGRGLAVAGTHGKTTTSWMLWHALDGIAGELPELLAAPGALVGGLNPALACDSTPLGSNAVGGAPDGLFALEACEYDRSFLELGTPRGAIVTNVEADHLDYYGDLAAIELAFASFVDQVHHEGLCVLGPDVPGLVEHACHAPVWRLGRELRVLDDGPGEGVVDGRRRFRLEGPGWRTPSLHLGMPGPINVENGALALGLAIGIAQRGQPRVLWPAIAAAAARGLERFGGAGRRFEYWSRPGQRAVVHDYAHHPTEVRALLAAAREAFAGATLHVLFQPHQHSRTSRFLDDFAHELGAADRVVVAPVYGARKHIDGRQHAGAAELVAAIDAAGCTDTRAESATSLDAAVERFAAGLNEDPQGVALVLGAGDVDEVRDELEARLGLALSGAAAR